MKVIIRLKDKELGDELAKALDTIVNVGGEVWNLPADKKLTDKEVAMLFNIGLPYPIDNYVFVEDSRGSVELFELMDDNYARLNRLSPEKLSGLCQWRGYNHTFCLDSDKLLEELVWWKFVFDVVSMGRLEEGVAVRYLR